MRQAGRQQQARGYISNSSFLSASLIAGEQGNLLEMDVVEYRKGGEDGSIELGSYIGDGKVSLYGEACVSRRPQAAGRRGGGVF